MTKADYINYWRTTAEKDWAAVGHLFEKGDFLQCLFFAHLVLEKLLKAHVVKDNVEDFPPKTHNLLLLNSKTKLNTTVETLKVFSQLNQFQIDGRYPDYKFNLFTKATKSFTSDFLAEITPIKLWLENSL